MAFLGTEKLKQLISAKNVIDPPNLSRVVCGSYELSLGNEIYRTDSKDKKKEFLSQPKEQITINPGQFALLLSNETVNIPVDKIAFISIKAGIKLRGLVNVSGFHVDPGFKGKLVFSVYNAGSGPISLLRNEPCFLIWFADLDLLPNEATSYENGSHDHKNQDTIPAKYIDSLNAMELASPNVLLEKINDNYKTLDNKINARDYIIKTGLGILVVIGIKLLVDWGMYNKGVNDGYSKKSEEIKIDSTINKLTSERNNLIIEIDSLRKIKNDTTTNK